MYVWLAGFGEWLGERLQAGSVAEAPGSLSHTGYPVRKETERGHSARSSFLFSLRPQFIRNCYSYPGIQDMINLPAPLNLPGNSHRPTQVVSVLILNSIRLTMKIQHHAHIHSGVCFVKLACPVKPRYSYLQSRDQQLIKDRSTASLVWWFDHVISLSSLLRSGKTYQFHCGN